MICFDYILCVNDYVLLVGGIVTTIISFLILMNLERVIDYISPTTYDKGKAGRVVFMTSAAFFIMALMLTFRILLKILS